MSSKTFLTLLCICSCIISINAASIISVSIPDNSMDATCEPRNSGVWASSPLNVNSGIGYWVNPNFSGTYVLHDHVYIADNIPDPSRSVVTYQFNEAVIVDQITIYQHTRGISQIEGFVGDSLSSMTSVGSVFSNRGDVTGWTVFSEWEATTFSFSNNTLGGTYFKMVVRKTPWVDGYAAYRGLINFTEASSVPEPMTIYIFSLAVIFAFFLKKDK